VKENTKSESIVTLLHTRRESESLVSSPQGTRKSSRPTPNFFPVTDGQNYVIYVKNSDFCQKNFGVGYPLPIPPK